MKGGKAYKRRTKLPGDFSVSELIGIASGK